MSVCALAGGVGGAKLAAGLQEVLPPGELSVVVNSADDFRLWGLHVSPDLDTVMYTLADLANPATGWGVRDETFRSLAMIERYGEEAWFGIGDRDLATHVLRTARLDAGASLAGVTASFASALGVASRILPMCEEPVSTVIETPGGPLDFQQYFVRRGQRDEVIGVLLRGIEEARMPPAVADELDHAEAIVLCPSNPIVSIGPILAVPGMRGAIEASRAPVVAVSPIVGGRALKGPADRMMASLGHEVSATGVARMYAGLVDGIVIDRVDEGAREQIEALGLAALATDAVMRDEGDRARLAQEVVDFARELGGR